MAQHMSVIEDDLAKAIRESLAEEHRLVELSTYKSLQQSVRAVIMRKNIFY